MLRPYNSTSAVIVQIRWLQNIHGRWSQDVDDVYKAEVLQLGSNSNILLFEFMDDVRHALVTPLLNENGLDAMNVQNYSSISNLTYISKHVKRMVCQQLTGFLNEFWTPAKAAIWILSTTFDRNGDVEGPVRCLGCSRSTRGDPLGAA